MSIIKWPKHTVNMGSTCGSYSSLVIHECCSSVPRLRCSWLSVLYLSFPTDRFYFFDALIFQYKELTKRCSIMSLAAMLLIVYFTAASNLLSHSVSYITTTIFGMTYGTAFDRPLFSSDVFILWVGYHTSPTVHN